MGQHDDAALLAAASRPFGKQDRDRVADRPSCGPSVHSGAMMFPS